jgi:D-alanyl-D-alanine carboxypeptidase (penicillin-binding protein 5/6)
MTHLVRFLGLAAPALLVAVHGPACVVEAAPLPSPPLGPAAAVLMDVRTGRLLYGRAMHQRLPPASTTKILTALIVIERLAPQTVVTISRSAAALRTGAVIGLEAGQQWTVDDLLHALLLHSANDAAVALAEATAGGVTQFAHLMNAKARSVGARASRFTNPSGLHDPRHYTTAYDLALIARAALQQPRFAEIVRRSRWVLHRPGQPSLEIVNRNNLLASYEGADGVKTGHTPAAGYTLVGSASRDGWQLLAVVLRSQNMYEDVRRLLDYGFGQFAPRIVARRGEPVASVRLGPSTMPLIATVPQDVIAVTRRGATVSIRVTWRPGLHPPVAVGAPVGSAQFLEGSTVIARTRLVAMKPLVH